MSSIRSFEAVSQFRSGNFDAAIDTFLELDINPAKIVALYPEAVSGRLSVPEERWIPLFGGPPPPPLVSEPATIDDESAHHSEESASAIAELQDKAGLVLPDMGVLSASNSLTGRWKTSFGALITGAAAAPSVKDDDAASIRSSAPRTPPRSSSLRRNTMHGMIFYGDLSVRPLTYRMLDDTPRRAVETLIRYLSDRRPKVYPSLSAVGITPGNQSHKIPSLNETPVEELFELPNLPLSALTPEQLLRFAQIVDTALFKSYLNLTNRGVLVGSLCRIPNWIEITEVEEELRARNVSGFLSRSIRQPLMSCAEILGVEGSLQWKGYAQASLGSVETVGS